MNYWPAEVCNLSELHEPLHKLIASLVEPGRKTAQGLLQRARLGGARHHQPLGLHLARRSTRRWGATVSGSAWLCQHLWEHYAFTRDREFLALGLPDPEGVGAVLPRQPDRGAEAQVARHRPVQLAGEPLPACPTASVAHVCLGPTIDMQLLRELFGNTARAAEILGVDADLRRELAEKRARLAPNQIGPDGRLQEWLEPYPEPEPTHRHTSHLYGLHPYDEITLRGTPELAAACRKSLDVRGDDSNGWALAWRINFWARLGDGDRAHKLLQALLHLTGETALNYTGQGAGTYAEPLRRLPAVPDRRQLRRLRRHRRDAAAVARRRDRTAARAAQGLADRQRQGPARVQERAPF